MNDKRAYEIPIDYTEFERMYADAMRATSYCPHTDAVTVDENSVYHMNCTSCGLVGMAGLQSALKLGWIV